MFKKPLPILAVSGFARTVNHPESTLHDLEGNQIDADAKFFEIFQNKVRRASRYVKFSNLAAMGCIQQIPMELLKEKKVGLFLGTGLGNTPDTVKFTEEVLNNYETSVSPGMFINTVSNAGLFYVARAMGIECFTNVISQETVSFEAALLTAAMMLDADEIDVALVGGADVIEPPYEISKERIHSSGASLENLGEGAAFLVLAREALGEKKALGYLTSVEVGVGEMQTSYKDSPLVAYGVDHERTKLPNNTYDYRRYSGDYSTGSAFGLCRFIVDNHSPCGELLHLSHHSEGLYAQFVVEK